MKKYESYKDSGIEWFGEIPEHWSKNRVKRIVNIQGRVGYKGYTVGDLVKEGEGPYTLGAKHINKGNKLNLVDPEFISWEKYYESPEIMVYEGDILLTQRGTLGKVALVDSNIGEATINPSMVLLNRLGCNERFLYYFFNTHYFNRWIDLTNTATAVPMISQEQLGNLELVLPPKREQESIAKFLHAKTSQIDNLIQKKQQMIALLEEEKTAVINEAVIRGLNPDAPMKDSGIEWLGMIPEHWEVKKLKYIIKDLESGVSVNSTEISIEDREIGILKTSCVYSLKFESKENKKVVESDLNRVKCHVRKDSIIISRMNTPDLVGASGYSAFEIPNLYLPDRLWQTVLFKEVNINVRWLSFLMIADAFRSILSSKATGTSSSMKNISKEDLLNISIGLPPLEEQVEVLNSIIKKLQKTAQSLSLLKKEISLLKEYRTALISEAVTGKIDVRDYQPEQVISPVLTE